MLFDCFSPVHFFNLVMEIGHMYTPEPAKTPYSLCSGKKLMVYMNAFLFSPILLRNKTYLMANYECLFISSKEGLSGL